PRDVAPVVAVALLLALRRESERPPQHHVVVDEGEAPRHHADDREWLTVETNVAANDRAVAAERTLPQRVTEDRAMFAADLAFAVAEDAAELRRDAEQPEKRRGDVHQPDARWRAVLIHADVAR